MAFSQAKIYDDIFRKCADEAAANNGQFNPDNVAKHFLGLMDDSVDKGSIYFNYIGAQQIIEKFGLIRGHARLEYTGNFRLHNPKVYWSITKLGQRLLKMPRFVRVGLFFVRLSWRKISGFLAAFGFISILAKAWSGFEVLEGWMGYAAAGFLALAATLLNKHKGS